jgi:hypothetical protein
MERAANPRTQAGEVSGSSDERNAGSNTSLRTAMQLQKYAIDAHSGPTAASGSNAFSSTAAPMVVITFWKQGKDSGALQVLVAGGKPIVEASRSGTDTMVEKTAAWMHIVVSSDGIMSARHTGEVSPAGVGGGFGGGGGEPQSNAGLSSSVDDS